MDPTILNDLLAALRDSIFNVLTQNGTPFQQLGLTIFRTLVISMIVIAGTVELETALMSFAPLRIMPSSS